MCFVIPVTAQKYKLGYTNSGLNGYDNQLLLVSLHKNPVKIAQFQIYAYKHTTVCGVLQRGKFHIMHLDNKGLTGS